MITSLSQKNLPLNASTDLGLGDQLQQNVENQNAMIRKKKQTLNSTASANAAGLTGSAVSDLLSISSSSLGV